MRSDRQYPCIKILENKTTSYKELKLISNLFEGNHMPSNYIVFFNLLIPDQIFLNMKDLQTFQKELWDSNKDYKFDYNYINKAFFFLFGYQGQSTINTRQLPASYILNNCNADEIKKINNEKNNPLIEENYDIPNYETQDNFKILERSLKTLPRSSPLEVNQSFISGFVGVFNDYLCGFTSFSYVMNNLIENSHQDTFYTSYVDICGGIAFMKNLYLCLLVTMMASPQYFLNKWMDCGIGIGFIIPLPPVFSKFCVGYNPYNNCLYASMSVYFATCIYGQENFDLEEDEEVLASITYV